MSQLKVFGCWFTSYTLVIKLGLLEPRLFSLMIFPVISLYNVISQLATVDYCRILCQKPNGKSLLMVG